MAEPTDPKTPAEIRKHLIGMIAITKRAIERMVPNSMARTHAMMKLDEAQMWFEKAELEQPST